MQRLVYHTMRSAGAADTLRAARAHAPRYVVAALVMLGLPSVAHAATRYVADTGNDGAGCGLALSTACRSITQAIGLAAPGDTILVGPGRYGDLNRNGALGDIAGEETGSPGCGCVLSINKNVIVISSAGAAVTTIDGRKVHANANVLVITVGGEFGRPGKGFTVTHTAQRDSMGRLQGDGIVLDAEQFMVRGNQVVYTAAIPLGPSQGYGILTVNDATIRIEGNHVARWAVGISGRGGAVISKNQVLQNVTGIAASGGDVVGNVVTGNDVGIEAKGSAAVTSNAAYTNNLHGIMVLATFSGVISKNNVFGNTCGVGNFVGALSAENNYWGSPTGPVPGSPADFACNFGPTDVTPFATKPFTVKVLKP